LIILNVYLQCVSECALNATGINVNGEVNIEKGIEVLSIAVNNDTELVPVIRKAIEDCVADVRSKEALFQVRMIANPPSADEKFCHPKSGVLVGCVYARVFMVCNNLKIFL
jgi:hypothetical protein